MYSKEAGVRAHQYHKKQKRKKRERACSPKWYVAAK
jgi:hypothetical protein